MSNLIYPSRIKHFIHNHVLELTTSNQVGPNSLCAKCKQRNAFAVSGSTPPSSDFYVCRSCDYFIHVPCIQVPSHLIKHAAPPKTTPDNIGLAASRTVAVLQNPRQTPPGRGDQLTNAMATVAARAVGKTVMEKVISVGHATRSDGGDISGVNTGSTVTEGAGGIDASDVIDGASSWIEGLVGLLLG